MRQPSRVLVAVDYSEPARAAFAQALALSRAADARLTVVHAVAADEPFRWAARQRLELTRALVDDARAARVRLEVSVQHGDPAAVLLLHARSRRPDLIVVGTHQRTGLNRLRAGSVAERVARGAPCPVLVVRGDAAIAPTFDNIVVGVDFSAASDRAVEQAMALARHRRGRVTLVHVVEAPGPAHRRSAYTYHLDVPEYQAWLARDASHRLEAIPRNGNEPGRVLTRVLIGDPSSEIERVADEVGADLVVVGRTRRNALVRRLTGTMAGRVIRKAGRAVLVVPEKTVRLAEDPSPRESPRLAA